MNDDSFVARVYPATGAAQIDFTQVKSIPFPPNFGSSNQPRIARNGVGDTTATLDPTSAQNAIPAMRNVEGKYARFMKIARGYAELSKLPGTRVGCVILDHRFATLAEGWNGAPCGCSADVDERSIERETRLQWTVHAEANAIAAAARLGHSVEGATMICTLMPCMTCAKLIVQAGISRVVCPTPGEESARWVDEFKLARQLFNECGVQLVHIDITGERE